MTKKQDTKDWTTKFFEKNAWAIVMLVASLLYFFGGFFSNNNAEISALAKDVDRIEQAIILISENQDKIIILQQQQIKTNENIQEIKQDIRDIKQALKIL